ncbi:MAG: bifunctional riboflavin kinase/FAD synthetase [Rhodobiaceae bacterium]|nr:bifunctional riboflavin kinase/FAD synthetase [Rhodobiaceae bacterium]MCC0040652.1 bifunctional riboflavin kinase/FAD synthetase [Rhodobiaceae bacterium]
MSSADPFLVVRDGDDAAPFAGCAVAIGNFDGVHRGHQAVIGAARAMAGRLRCPAIALTFEPHPRQVFAPHAPLFRLSLPEAKLHLLRATGLGGALVVGFDRDFAANEAQTFVDEVLVARLGARAVAVGDNFHFGRARAGNPALLTQLGREKGFEVEIVGPQGDDDTVFSSSAVRAHLAAGELAAAAAILGYRWFFEAEVVHGEKRGRDLGYPTANMALDPACGLRQGVYAVRAVIDGETVGGVANFGTRPQFDDGAPLFETFFFDVSRDLYGKTLAVTPLAFLRGEAKFDSVAALIAQMDADAEAARGVIAALAASDPVADFPMARALARLRMA